MTLARAAQETLGAIDRGSYVAPSGAEVSIRAAVDAAGRGTIVYRP
ncbi:MAG: poly(ADP-ribose) glycohydrolase domain-containing protein, partial [Polyangia bacterium]